MDTKHWLGAAVGGMALALLAMPAAAATISGAMTSIKAVSDESSIVEQTHWRRHHRYYYGGYYPYYYYSYPTYSYSYYPSYYYYSYPRYRYYYGRRHHHHYGYYRRW